MEDLDSLLEDLGRGKYSPASSSGAKKPPSRPVSSRVDLNELEDLMEDLAAPTARPTPTAIPEPIVEKKPEPVIKYEPEPIVEKKPEPVIKYEPEPIITKSDPEKSADATNVDDLEALMESLNMVSNKRASKREPTPIATARPASTHNLEPTRPVSTYNPPTVTPTQPTPVYTPPTPVYTPPTPAYTPPPAAAPPRTSMGPTKGDELDRLLNNLTHQMDHIEPDNPASRGTCFGCKGGIIGEMVQAMGRTYHPEHFACGNCRDPLGTKNFYEQGGQPICSNCYQMLYCPKCAHCDQPVSDRCITALGKKWHPEHFICCQCLKPFPNGSFFERDGRPYCEADFFGLFASKCAACQEPIKGDSINALGQQWHPEHFVCTYCGKAFGGSFFEHGGKPYCEAHYHQQTGSLCGGCGKAINGRSVTALDKKWHPEHFVCAFCMNPLAGGTFSEKNNKAYCKECHSKLFGN